MEKKIIDRIVAGNSAPGIHELWLDTSSDEITVKVNMSGSNSGWKTVGVSPSEGGEGEGGEGGEGAVTENDRIAINFYKLLFNKDTYGNICGIMKMKVQDINPYSYMTDGQTPVGIVPGDEITVYNFATMDDSDMEDLIADIVANNDEDYPSDYLLARSEPVYGTEPSDGLIALYIYYNGGQISCTYSQGFPLAVRIDGKDYFWYGFSD